MPQRRKNDTTANLGFEAKLWAPADALRNNMDAAEYKHVVLGLIFLKYISDAFEAKHADLGAQKTQGADPEDPDEYRAGNIGDISIYGQESNYTTWRLAKMNLAIRGIELPELGRKHSLIALSAGRMTWWICNSAVAGLRGQLGTGT